jgi:hypothetical protein
MRRTTTPPTQQSISTLPLIMILDRSGKWGEAQDGEQPPQKGVHEGLQSSGTSVASHSTAEGRTARPQDYNGSATLSRGGWGPTNEGGGP